MSVSKHKQNLITKYFYRSDRSDNNRDNKSDTCIDIEKNEVSICIDSLIENTYGYNDKTGNWHCLECGDNMGDNPRQLCGKGYCYNNI